MKKPVKKEFITEKAAIKILAEAGIVVSHDHMAEFSKIGVVPAYIKFKPTDKELYQGAAFHFVDPEEIDIDRSEPLTSVTGTEIPEWNVLPYPIPDDGILKLTTGFTYGGKTEVVHEIYWKVFAERNDGKLVDVSDEHYVRVYAPQEVRQSAENARSYLDGNGYQPMVHSCCETWEYGETEITTTGSLPSPFFDEANALNFKKRIRKNQSSEDTAKSKKSELIVISAMLKIIENLITQQAGREYNQNKITNLITGKIFPGVIESRTVNGLFAAANKMPEELAIKAREKFDALANFPMATKPEQKK
ncbi:hypothetical protein [Pseudomonas moorei]|uniref:hypothetical protein n=1 Tax=Pseudomonas moorei TaxID=395599 RepID=UPI001FF62BD3|nr:hypothetical protein [Pseudomonas moorei]